MLNWNIKLLAALPQGEVFLYNYIEKTNTRQVVKVNNQGDVMAEVYKCVQCNEIEGTIVLGDKFYVTHKNGTLVQIRLADGILQNVYQIPNVVSVRNYGSLSSDPDLIPDTDLLLLVDTYKDEVFEYNVSTNEKRVVITGIQTPQSVSYFIINSKIYYVVCEYWKETPQGDRISVYNSTWHFIGSFGSLGSQDGQLNNPEAAIESPEGTVIVAD